VIELEQAQARILAAIQSLPAESVLVRESAGRFLAEDIAAPISLPRFDNSAMDGYALRAEDATKASASSPARLRCIGVTPAGTNFDGTVQPGTCVRVFTGSPLPASADAVVMQEDTRVVGELIEVLDGVKPWENVRFSGQDVKQGTLVARSGERLRATGLALLGAVGIERVRVARQPAVGILSTGSELIEAGQSLAVGQIYESNRASLAVLVRDTASIPHVFPLVSDNFEETVTALRSAFEVSDAVITTGGASVGEHDLVKAAFESLGGAVEFWRVAIKPGKPFVFGRYGQKLLFALPGNPVSAFVTFLLLVRPALLKLQGAADPALPTSCGLLAEPIQNLGERRHFVRVVMDRDGAVRCAGIQASHALASLAGANGLLDMPPKTSWPVGRAVQVSRWEI
jgi:molybdopterin molybdotransferase